ncbi:MAG: hypothetical protein ACD_23C00027G0001, partial [uncultured bacterium]
MIPNQSFPRNLGRRYELRAERGRGAMGCVYRAYDKNLAREIAIKQLIIPHSEEDNDGAKSRFIQEARAAANLSEHPNIVQVYDVGEVGGGWYLFMEFIDGLSLLEYIKNDSKWPLQLTLICDLAAQIADGLSFAHSKGIIHRDVKSSNILIVPGDEAKIKIVDFGIAHHPASTITAKGAVIGTLKYMSPEAFSGENRDPRRDIFSLGVVLFEMLTRKTPFELPGITAAELIHRICHVDTPKASAQISGVPQEFDDILDHALAKKPDDRYEDARFLAKALRDLKTSLAETLRIPRDVYPQPGNEQRINAVLTPPLDLWTPGPTEIDLIAHYEPIVGKELAQQLWTLSRASISAVANGDFDRQVALGSELQRIAGANTYLQGEAAYFVAEGLRLRADIEANAQRKA